MEETSFKVYGYRWIVLLAFMGIVVANQCLWITFAPITSTAAASRELVARFKKRIQATLACVWG